MPAYVVINKINGKVYVGKTDGEVHLRWVKHIGAARRGSYFLIHRALRKYGPSLFDVVEIPCFGDLNELERALIIALNANTAECGYNQTTGGEGTHCKRSAETRARMSLSAKARGLSANFISTFGHRKGAVVPLSVVEKMKAGLRRNNVHSPERQRSAALARWSK